VCSSDLIALVVLTAIASGLLLGGPTDAFIAGLGASLGVLIALGMLRA